MKKVYINVQRAGNRCVIEMSIGNITAIYKRIGDLSKLTSHGRGNVRQVKALVREFVRNSDPAIV
ncbi:hypothetical protein FEM41_14835 [Jejubacter calystegiae]|uniref:Uncharacterized protein n=1 Tax=Jejubacter calystegiae TaxID=2579935 RepID=A0A4P8YJG1_9ENTR|nr:hypothetical protein FEM41_14835 [Jejubacter calystegiae]